MFNLLLDKTSSFRRQCIYMYIYIYIYMYIYNIYICMYFFFAAPEKIFWKRWDKVFKNGPS